LLCAAPQIRRHLSAYPMPIFRTASNATWERGEKG
jgi:hypothetical protein